MFRICEISFISIHYHDNATGIINSGAAAVVEDIIIILAVIVNCYCCYRC